MCVCKYLNQRVRRISKQNEKISSVLQKQKRKKTYEGIEFHNFLLSFASCRKVLGKMPAYSLRYPLYIKKSLAYYLLVFIGFEGR